MPRSRLPVTLTMFLVALGLLTGCSYKRLTVTDLNGNPVEGAAVMAQGSSINGETSYTDAQGLTIVNDPKPQEGVMISINKEGVGSALIAYPVKWPAVVTLRTPRR